MTTRQRLVLSVVYSSTFIGLAYLTNKLCDCISEIFG